MLRIFTKIDCLSPSITLFYFVKKSHSSFLGGVLTILMIICSFFLLVYYAWILFTHQNPNVYVYKQFEYEAGTYYFNSSSYYHFIQMFSDNERRDKEFDPSVVCFFMTRNSLNFPTNQSVLKEDHWLYDRCEESDKQGLDEDLFKNVSIFVNSACLKYYYNSTAKTHYKIGDPNYIDPFILHGNPRKDNLMLATFGVKCKNGTVMDSILGKCKTKEEIDDYLTLYASVGFHMIDHQVDPSVYSEPIQKYFIDITGAISKSGTFHHHNINISPLRVKSNIGYIFDE